MCIFSLLELTTIFHILDQSREMLATAIQGHMHMLSSRGFKIEKVHVNPHKSLAALGGDLKGVAP